MKASPPPSLNYFDEGDAIKPSLGAFYPLKSPAAKSSKERSTPKPRPPIPPAYNTLKREIPPTAGASSFRQVSLLVRMSYFLGDFHSHVTRRSPSPSKDSGDDVLLSPGPPYNTPPTPYAAAKQGRDSVVRVLEYLKCPVRISEGPLVCDQTRVTFRLFERPPTSPSGKKIFSHPIHLTIQ